MDNQFKEAYLMTPVLPPTSVLTLIVSRKRLRRGKRERCPIVCFQIYSLVRICYVNLTIQFETLLCFAVGVFLRHLFVRDKASGVLQWHIFPRLVPLSMKLAYPQNIKSMAHENLNLE